MRQKSDASRALRRHHRERLMKNRRWHWGRDLLAEGDRKALSAAARTSAPCSCWMCGNPRKHFNEPTIGELRARQFDSGPQAAWAAYREGEG